MSDHASEHGSSEALDELQEWINALRSLVTYEGSGRAEQLLAKLDEEAQRLGLSISNTVNTPYRNTIPFDQGDVMPDDGKHLVRLTNFMRWNSIAIVMRGGKRDSSLGGHIASYASAAYLYEVGFQHFFNAASKDHGGDLVFMQGHSAPGIYARAFLEGRINENQLDGFRQEIFQDGLSSYPHPYLMKDFWQFPTVSMGLGPLMAIYQARFLKYMGHRGLLKTDNRRVWMYCGDGEMGEPESMGAITIAGREQLDNLIFVINCNLQSLDGPVCGNISIVQEFESSFRGAGWHVIKVLWGASWAPLFEKDTKGILQKRISELVDGEYQNYSAKDGAYMREHFFGKYPELLDLVADMTDEELKGLLDGGHDPAMIYSAYAQAVKHTGRPVVILIKTVKGYGMGGSGEALNIAHQSKKMTLDDLKSFRDRFDLPLTDDEVENLTYKKPDADSPEMQYLQEQRKKLGGYLPARNTNSEKLIVPQLSDFQAMLDGSGEKEFASTMAYIRILSVLLKDKNIKERIVPILADESRTFGMEGLFRQVGIYSVMGQQYEPVDRSQLMYYKQDQKGQLLQEGISESGAMASWIASATSYVNNQYPMIPFYIYYAMFGYQRFGDLVWAAGDMQAKGFILGALAGRTSLPGEGLQHQDSHNLLMFSFVPNCVSYDACFAYELAVIFQDGLKRMYEDQEQVFYYITLMNENYQHPPMPKGVEEGIKRGLYQFSKSKKKDAPRAQLIGAGTILREAIRAAEILEADFDVAADVWSATSLTELRRDIETVDRHNRLHPTGKPKQSYVASCFEKHEGPIIAATDYVKLHAEQIRPALQDRQYCVLGTDGFGRSDTREALRDFFEVNANMIAYTTLKALADEDKFSKTSLKAAMKKLGIDPKRPDPRTH